MAAAAVGLMGEGAECVPAVIVRGWPDLAFNDSPGQDGFFIPAEEDIFAPLLENFLKFGRRSPMRKS
jgi:F420-0:gamma-glutamyl ligase